MSEQKKLTSVVRIAGDSGDGIQLMGTQFSLAAAFAENGLATFPDYPADIRAPAGNITGVSSFQIQFGSTPILTIGDYVDILVIMNPAALKANLNNLKFTSLIIVNVDSFTNINLKKVGFVNNPLEDDTLKDFNVLPLEIEHLSMLCVKEFNLSFKDAKRTKNVWLLGFLYWLFDRNLDQMCVVLGNHFKNKPEIANINVKTLQSGYHFAKNMKCPAFLKQIIHSKAHYESGIYRQTSGAEAISYGLIASSLREERELILCSYPITPASSILHIMASMYDFNVTSIQAEDEIAAVSMAIGVSYGGKIGVTSTSGPGISLKAEAIGLAVATELPLIIINAQRGGPSTGLPTKTEQSDLFQALYGRHGDAPLVVLAPGNISECFSLACVAIRLALNYMTPVILLTDGYLQNLSEPWRIPEFDTISVSNKKNNFLPDPSTFKPYMRDKYLSRPWVAAGTPKYAHRIGGLERNEKGHVTFDPDNHQQMTNLREQKIQNIAQDIPKQEISKGMSMGDLVLVGFGSTYGPLFKATSCLIDKGYKISHIHIRYLSPLPSNLETLLQNFRHILVIEMNTGQLANYLQGIYGIKVKRFNKVTGQPFKIYEIEDKVHQILGEL